MSMSRKCVSDSINDLSGEWQKACCHESVMEAYQDMDELWKFMVSESKLELYDTLTQGDHSITLIGDAEQLSPVAAK
jgi:hypothetical protein